ncbi:MAG: cupin domain-containing protein [Defluviitaleaceae bacterium]|nr:cupin domain-containing protein [Defluviitaleaceae bacterium]MCL2835470.1 cupin domain-containing protein [Defluviitaleaceae bacterium]
MKIEKALITNANQLTAKHQNVHHGYEYYRKTIISGENGNKCNVSVYEIPPGKSAYPYHYHFQSEEIFYIISGHGIVRTPDGNKNVTAGDILVFPAGEAGAHKLTNSSETEMLTYIDFDTYHSPEVSFMPDSNKSVIYGKGLRKIISGEVEVDYYKGE